MIKLLFTAVLALVLSGCASNVRTDFDAGAAFTSYSSWDFAPAKDVGDGYVSLDGGRIRAAIERAMALENLEKVTADQADLLVTWQIVTEERLERYGSGFGFGLGFGTGNFGWGLSAPAPIEKVQEGKLVVELVDSDSKQVVWRSASRRYLNESQSSESRQELINEIVRDMFAEYPPGA